jgi:hypothetical protein
MAGFHLISIPFHNLCLKTKDDAETSVVIFSLLAVCHSETDEFLLLWLSVEYVIGHCVFSQINRTFCSFVTAFGTLIIG